MEKTKLLGLFRACTNSSSTKQGKLIHQRILALGLQNNITLCKNLINHYISCQNYDSAKLVFDNIESPFDISMWNGLMAAYTKNHMYIEALELFGKLLLCPYLEPDSFTYPSVLKACGGLGRVRYGRMVHAHLVKSCLLEDIIVASSLSGLYGKCGLFGDCVKVFDEMPARDVASWNAVISCYYQHGKPEKVLELFEEMRASGFKPNSVTLTTAICACARVTDLERGRGIHMGLVQRGIVIDGFVSSALVDMYGKCGCLEMAREVFEGGGRKTVVAWNSMISGYSLIGDGKECIELLKRMTIEGIKPTLTTLSTIVMACSRSAQLRYGKFMHGCIVRAGIEVDAIVHIALIDLYFKCGKVQSAESVFRLMQKVDIACWNVMISGYVSIGNYFQALTIYGEMIATRTKPDAVTFASLLPACSQLAALEKGKEFHNSVTEHGLETNIVVMGALLDMYAKCGAVEEALDIFHKLPERDLVSWTSMITAYGSHGQALEALNLFREMQQSNAKPDGVTFLAVLTACSHAGLVDEGHYYFHQMIKKYDIKPKIEHYSCLIDLLGRVGRLREAYSILQNTEELRENFGLLSTLFSACSLYKDLELGEEIAMLLIEKDSNDPSTYITLSNLYASLKKWDRVRKVRLRMKELGIKKNPGCSWIEIGKRIQAFFVEDRSHPEADKVDECLNLLMNHMEKDERHNIRSILLFSERSSHFC